MIRKTLSSKSCPSTYHRPTLVDTSIPEDQLLTFENPSFHISDEIFISSSEGERQSSSFFDSETNTFSGSSSFSFSESGILEDIFIFRYI